MSEKIDGLDLDVTSMLQENYVPSESERKKVLMYYFLIGIIIVLSKNKLTRYEFFHLRQAMGRWAVFFLFLIVSMIWVFIPWLRFIPILVFLLLFIVWFIFAKQAWEGKYVVEINKDTKIFLPFFMNIGGWIISLFDLELEIDDGNEIQ